MMRLLCAMMLGVLLVGAARAERYATATSGGKGVVVHTRRAPVAVHRALPPYGVGKHVYQPRAK